MPDCNDPARQRELEQVAAILDFARSHAIALADTETNKEHERQPGGQYKPPLPTSGIATC